MKTHYTLTLAMAALCSASLLSSCGSDSVLDIIEGVTGEDRNDYMLPSADALNDRDLEISNLAGGTTTIRFSGDNAGTATVTFNGNTQATVDYKYEVIQTVDEALKQDEIPGALKNLFDKYKDCVTEALVTITFPTSGLEGMMLNGNDLSALHGQTVQIFIDAPDDMSMVHGLVDPMWIANYFNGNTGFRR